MNRALLALGLTSAVALAVPGVASAASIVDTYSAPIGSESENLGTYSINGHDVAGLVDFDLDIKSKATWTGNLSTHVGYSDSNVRQGAPLTVTRMSPFQTGKPEGHLDRRRQPQGDRVRHQEPGLVPGQRRGELSARAARRRVQRARRPRPGITLVKTPGLPGSPYVKLTLQAKFKVTPEGAIVSRSLSVGGSPAAPAKSLSLAPAFDYETLTLPCAPVGSDVSYRFGSFKYTPATKVTQQPHIAIGLLDPAFGAVELPAIYDQGFGGAIHDEPGLRAHRLGPHHRPR